MISNAKKAVIHIAKAQVGMTDDEYSALLSGVGVESSVDLSNKTFDKIMYRFERLGFQSSAKTRTKNKTRRKPDKLPLEKKHLMKKLEAIILDMDLSWAYVDAIAKKRFDVDAAQWLDGGDLYKLVQMMIIHQNRKTEV